MILKIKKVIKGFKNLLLLVFINHLDKNRYSINNHLDLQLK